MIPGRFKVCCFTSFTFSDVARARTLAQTLRVAHPDWDICAIVVDEPPPGLNSNMALAEFDRVIQASTLHLPRFRSWVFKHDIAEACAAVKGQALVELLDAGYAKVIYLDPDIAVFHSLDTIVRRLEGASILLTPHQSEPNATEAAAADHELRSMTTGIYNSGFAAVRNDANGRAFAAWWAEQLYRACYDEAAAGFFKDQKYCDLVPALFDNVAVERDPGCNVASWNLSRRTLRFVDGGLQVNGSPLRFYHFSETAGDVDVITERYGGTNSEVFEVWHWYRRIVKRNAVIGIPAQYWAYGAFSNGEPVPNSARVAFRNRADLVGYFENPFEVGHNSFYQWLRREEAGVALGHRQAVGEITA